MHMKFGYVIKEVEAFKVRLDQGDESNTEWRRSMELRISSWGISSCGYRGVSG